MGLFLKNWMHKNLGMFWCFSVPPHYLKLATPSFWIAVCNFRKKNFSTKSTKWRHSLLGSIAQPSGSFAGKLLVRLLHSPKPGTFHDIIYLLILFSHLSRWNQACWNKSPLPLFFETEYLITSRLDKILIEIVVVYHDPNCGGCLGYNIYLLFLDVFSNTVETIASIINIFMLESV